MNFLVGVKESGEILGWDRRKVSTYNLRGILPKPITSLSSGPIWFRRQIEYYKASRNSNLTTYYINNDVVYECKFNQQMIETDYQPKEIMRSPEGYIVYHEKDINQLKIAIKENNPLAQFLSLETLNFLYDLGILESVLYQEYCNQFLCEQHKKGDKLS